MPSGNLGDPKKDIIKISRKNVGTILEGILQKVLKKKSPKNRVCDSKE